MADLPHIYRCECDDCLNFAPLRIPGAGAVLRLSLEQSEAVRADEARRAREQRRRRALRLREWRS